MNIDDLPHGSGFNSDWTQYETRRANCFSTFYYPMNECGYYDGIVHFTLRVPKQAPSDWRVIFHGRGSQYLARKYDLRSYFEDIFAEILT